jgi:hypothetical protein
MEGQTQAEFLAHALKAAVGPLLAQKFRKVLAQAAQEADQGLPEEGNQSAQGGTD